ncbi:hypothetical protein SAMN04515620_11112 [Collimonas sp. OK607]|nr:hypothetical protein SAMN04515620_11112 [Collimonas sp. OK607]
MSGQSRTGKPERLTAHSGRSGSSFSRAATWKPCTASSVTAAAQDAPESYAGQPYQPTTAATAQSQAYGLLSSIQEEAKSRFHLKTGPVRKNADGSTCADTWLDKVKSGFRWRRRAEIGQLRGRIAPQAASRPHWSTWALRPRPSRSSEQISYDDYGQFPIAPMHAEWPQHA